MKKHYLYTHFRQDKNEIFYVGIGTKNKSDIKYNKYARAYNKVRRTQYWKNIVALNPNYIVTIINESDDYESLKKEEMRLIKLYGRKDLKLGHLCNMTNGGDGQLDRIWTEKSKKKLSLSKMGTKMSAEFCKNRSLQMLGNKLNEKREYSTEWRKKMSDINKGRIPWNIGRVCSKEEKDKIKAGIASNIKLCDGCNMTFDLANYTKWHGDKCLIGTIKDFIPLIKDMYTKGMKLMKISKNLGISYRAVYKLKENNLL